MRRHRSLTTAAALAALAVLLTGCGPPVTGQQPGAGSAAFGKYQDFGGQARAEAIRMDAKAEGTVSIYTSNTDIQELVDGFERAYPGIEVEVYRANSETVLQRVLQESAARRIGCDIVDTNDFELDVLSRQNVLVPYNGPGRYAVREEARFPKWTAERFNAFVIGWNTDLIGEQDRPKSLADLTGPQWKDRVSMELGDWDWYMAMHTYLTEQRHMSEAAVDSMFRKLVGNAKIVKGHTVQGELLSGGQFAVATSVYSHTVDNAAEKNAPVSWKPAAQPVVLRPNGLGLVAGAEHPASALLWTDWVLDEGQRIIADSNRIPAARSVPGFANPIPPGVRTYDVPVDALRAGSAEWQRAYDELVRDKPVQGN